MEFICSNPDAEYRVDRSWKGRVTDLKRSDAMVEADVSGKGSHMHIIVGKYAYGNFVCIPEWGVGSPLASLDDQFWNRERLTRYIGKADAITLSEALKLIRTAGTV
ncbi:MAG: hypothetical protein LUI10_01380 [Lachnospiraceae bacterium]|nr:hypothetical protein [Lachnospiraceae bacterium]